MTSIHEFVRNNDLIKVEEYISSGGDINVIDKLKRTPLHLAAWNGNLEIVTCLFKHNATIDAKAMDGFNPLHFAVQSNGPQSAECVRLLCKKGKSCGLLSQRVTKGNKTALHLAAPKGNAEIITILLENGLDPMAKTGSGQSAIDLAKDPKIIRLLSEHLEALAKTKKASKPSNQSEQQDKETKEEDKVIVEEKGEKETGVVQECKEESKTLHNEVKQTQPQPPLPLPQLPPQPAIASSILSILQKRKENPPTHSDASKEKEQEDKQGEKGEEDKEEENDRSLKKPRLS